MSWGLDDALYGLRNLYVGDDEQTRIADSVNEVEPVALRDEVAKILLESDYDKAYEVAIWPSLRNLDPSAVRIAIAGWVDDWDDGTDEWETLEEAEVQKQDLRDGMFAIYLEMKERM